MAQPGLKRLPLTKARASVFLIAVLCGLSLGPSGHAEGSDGISTNVRISATVQDVSVGEALEIVGALAGRPIEVTGAIGDRRISVNLQSVTLEEALDRILYRLNYVVVWSLDDRLSIRILDSNAEDSESAARRTAPIEEDFDEPLSLFPGDDEVVPPSQPGEPGLTIDDVNYYSSLSAELEPDGGEVVPPSESEPTGITAADIEFFVSQQDSRSSEAEVVPPDIEGDPGLTMTELEAMRSDWLALPPSQNEVLPPDLPGEKGLTLEGLREQLRSMPQPPPASDLPAEIVPPE